MMTLILPTKNQVNAKRQRKTAKKNWTQYNSNYIAPTGSSNTLIQLHTITLKQNFRTVPDTRTDLSASECKNYSICLPCFICISKTKCTNIFFFFFGFSRLMLVFDCTTTIRRLIKTLQLVNRFQRKQLTNLLKLKVVVYYKYLTFFEILLISYVTDRIVCGKYSLMQQLFVFNIVIVIFLLYPLQKFVNGKEYINF